MPKEIGVGSSFVIYENIPEIPIFTDQWNLGDQQLVYNGELDAITTAVEYASKIATLGDHFNIYSDN